MHLRMLGIALALCACAPMDTGPPEAEADGPDDRFHVSGKADGAAIQPCAEQAVLDLLNDDSTTWEGLKAAGVHTRAAKNLMAARDAGQRFDDLAEVDAISYVGPVAMRQLIEAVGPCQEPAPVPADDAEVVFSPQAYHQSHLARIRTLVDGAQTSVDVAMYSFRDAGLLDAIRDAVLRGVTVRVIFESANKHRKKPAGTRSEALELAGADVRYVNKIMHHKFAIIDGARFAVADAGNGTLVTGSGNWSHSAATRFDENALILFAHAEANLRYQREFERMWAFSRDFVGPLGEDNPVEVTEVEVSDADILAVDDPGFDALFTSANFRTYNSSRYGGTFATIRGEDTVADGLIALIEGAQTSIHIATGHLRSRPIAEALMRAVEAKPELDIRVYLDGQEYVSWWAQGEQLDALEACLVKAGSSESKRVKCINKNFLFGLTVSEAGVDVRYKYYAYRWDHSYADQMHHKYAIIDGRWLATGSYNYSDNAEHQSFENMAILDGQVFGAILAAYEANFETLWVTGEGQYAPFLSSVVNTDEDIPLVFAPMALQHHEIAELKRQIIRACPDVTSAEWRGNPTAHRVCYR